MAKAKAMGIQEKVQRVLIALTYAKASDSGQDVADEMRASITRLESEDEKQGRVTGLSLLMPGEHWHASITPFPSEGRYRVQADMMSTWQASV